MSGLWCKSLMVTAMRTLVKTSKVALCMRFLDCLLVHRKFMILPQSLFPLYADSDV